MKAVFTFGRMNPPTVGHQKLVDKVRTVARLEKGEPLVYLSHTQDKKKNPLDYKSKIKYAKKAFGKVVQMSMSNTIIKVLQELEKKGYSEVVLVVGSDRVKDMDALIQKYNGKDYNFDSLKTVSAGERDPDADGVEGMSASKMRQAVVDGDFESFKTGLPPLMQKDAQKVFDEIKSGMQLKEHYVDLLDEAFSPKTTSYGVEAGSEDGAFKNITMPGHGKTMFTVFNEKLDHYLVYLDSKNEVGFMTYVSEEPYAGFGKTKLSDWADSAKQENRKYSRNALGIFNKVFYVLLEMIKKSNTKEVKFAGATKILDDVYSKMTSSESFLKNIGAQGFKYKGKEGSHYVFTKGENISEEDELEEGKLAKIAALAIALGLGSTGDGAFAKDNSRELKQFNKTYNSLTIQQKNKVDYLITNT